MKYLFLVSCLIPYNLFACNVCIEYAYEKLTEARAEWHKVVTAKQLDYIRYHQLLGQCTAYQDMYETALLMHGGDVD